MIKFKDLSVESEFDLIKPRLKELLLEMCSWVESRGYEFLVTDLMSTVAEDAALNRVSTSHREGRAADVRVIHWPKEFRNLFELTFEKKYNMKIAAIARSSRRPDLVVIHDNSNGIHAHIQIRNII